MVSEPLFPQKDAARKPPRCHLPWQEMVIQADGTVEPCCYWTAHGNSNPALGNINDHTIEEIWNNENYRSLRRNMAAGKLKAAGCANCYALKQGMTMGLEYDSDADKPENQETAYATNIRTLKEEIAAGADALKAKPTILSATASHKCNLACTHCYQNASRTRQWTRKDVFQEIEALAPTLVRLIAGGGEPLLLTRWRRFISEFRIEKAPFLNFGMTTNATTLQPAVLEGLKKFKSLHIIVSMDGASSEVYDKIRINGDFKEVEKNIQVLKALVASRPKTSVSTFGLCMSVMKSNITHLPDFVRWAAREGVAFSMHPVLSMPISESLATLNDPAVLPQWRKALDKARMLIKTIESENLPELWRSTQKIKGRASREAWPFIDAFESFIPWHVEGRRHQQVDGSLPPETISAIRKLHPERNLSIFFKSLDDETLPLYYAPVAETGHYSVRLPFGAYNTAVIEDFEPSEPYGLGQFVVTPSSAGFENFKTFSTAYRRFFAQAAEAAA